jgi:hypothetical protein
LNPPELLIFDGNWNDYEEILYSFYQKEIAYAGLLLDGLPVRCRFHPPTKNRGYGFWHCIQEGNVEDDRLPDLRRCERIQWIAWMIQNAENNESISWWEEKRGTETDRLLWLEDEDYLVVLAKRRDYWLLKTAYLSTGFHKKVTLRKNRERFWSNQKD